MPRKRTSLPDMERALELPLVPEIRPGPRTRSQTRNLPHAFQELPIHGAVGKSLNRINRRRVKRFVALGITNNTFKTLVRTCSPEQLKDEDDEKVVDQPEPAEMNIQAEPNISLGLGVNKINKLSPEEQREYLLDLERRAAIIFNASEIPKPKKRKVKRSRINKRKKPQTDSEPLPKTTVEDIAKIEQASEFCCAAAEAEVPAAPEAAAMPNDPEMMYPEGADPGFYPPWEWMLPGVDVLIRVRIHRPFKLEEYEKTLEIPDLFYYDLVMSGRHRVVDIRDKFICSENTDEGKEATNGFLFIKDTFYVDNNAPEQHAAYFRQWCAGRSFVRLPMFDMRERQLDQLNYKINSSDVIVYIHNGNCEHIIVFTEIRLLTPFDPLSFSDYPRIFATSTQDTETCIKCEDSNTKFIVCGCPKLPYNMALVCQRCIESAVHSRDCKNVCKLRAYPLNKCEFLWFRPSPRHLNDEAGRFFQEN